MSSSSSSSSSYNQSNLTGNTIIYFNVGSTRFQTFFRTLKEKGENYLSQIVENHFENRMSATLDRDGEIFIDRNSVCFKIILEYLRTGSLQISSNDNCTKDQLLTELDYYQIPFDEKLINKTNNNNNIQSDEEKQLIETLEGYDLGIDDNLINESIQKIKLEALNWVVDNLEGINKFIYEMIQEREIYEFELKFQIISMAPGGYSGYQDILMCFYPIPRNMFVSNIWWKFVTHFVNKSSKGHIHMDKKYINWEKLLYLV